MKRQKIDPKGALGDSISSGLRETTAKETQETLHAVTGWTERQHRQLAQEGFYPAPIRGKYDPLPTWRGLCRYLMGRLQEKETTSERDLLARAKRLKLERELAVAEGKTLDAASVRKALSNLSRNMALALQRALEQDLPVRLVGMDRTAIHAELQKTRDEIHAEFFSKIRAWMDDPGPVAPPSPANTAKESNGNASK